jgi:hypothetical protein
MAGAGMRLYTQIDTRFTKTADVVAISVAKRATSAGYTIGPVYHGSASEGIKVFDPGKAGTIQTSDWGKGIYFTPSRGMADAYRITAIENLDKETNEMFEAIERRANEMGTTGMMKWMDWQAGKISEEQYRELKDLEDEWRTAREKLRKTQKGVVYPVYLKIDNPAIYRYVGITDPYLASMERGHGHDGLIITDEDADVSKPIRQWAEEIIVFDSRQIKSAAPTTYDDQGNPILLEKRFDSSNPDIRY